MAAPVATLVNQGDRFHTGLDVAKNSFYVIMVNGTYTGGTIGFFGSPQGDVAANAVAPLYYPVVSPYIPILGDPMDYNSAQGTENSRVLTANQGAIWYFSPPYGAFTDFEVVALTALGGSLSVWFFPYTFPLATQVSSDQVPANPIVLLQGIFWGLEELRLLTAQGLNVTADYKQNPYTGQASIPVFNN